MTSELAKTIKENILSSYLTIYDEIKIGDLNYWIPSNELEELLSEHLVGIDLNGLALRTRSKVVKKEVCKAIGYEVPKKFTKTQPRFLGQNFDIYTQKSNNLQIWNEEISPARRYVIIRISDNDIITKVKVITGDILSQLDKTGKLTQKYQAQLLATKENIIQFSNSDTLEMVEAIDQYNSFDTKISPSAYPRTGELMPMNEVFQNLKNIVGKKIKYISAIQERNRGAGLHNLVCEALGYSNFKDDGKFPDIKHQLVEVKLQTSPTIDLGLFLPNSEEALDIPLIKGHSVKMCDVRYAIFYGEVEKNDIVITKFYLINGKDFFNYFRQFGGKEINKKLQIPLPNNFL